MAGTIQYASHANFFTGMVQDIPRHLIPDGAVFDAQNIVITNSGSLSKRGASETALSVATTMSPVEVGSQRSASTDGKSLLYPVALSGGYLQVGSMQFSAFTQPLSTYTSTISATSTNTPTVYGDSLVYPIKGSASTPLVWCGGASMSGAATYTSLLNTITTVRGNNTINVGATNAANTVVGGYIFMTNAVIDEYVGRVVSVNSPNIVVDPPFTWGTATVPKTYTTYSYYPVLPQVGVKSDGQYVYSAGCCATFTSGGDSRIVIADIQIKDALSGTVSSHPNRIMWSVREAFDATVSTYNDNVALAVADTGVCDGLTHATRMGFPKLNFIDVEDIEQIIALVPVGSGNMMVLGTKNCVMLSGSLVTQQDTVNSTSLGRGGLTAGIRAFSQQVGCLSPKSVQRTTAGVMFAAQDGVYLTDGATLVNTMTKKIANLWGDSIAGTGLFTFDKSVFDGPDVFSSSGAANSVYGSANINDSHYYVSMSTGGFLCDLRAQFGWTRVKAGQLEIAGSTSDSDQTTNRIYAIKRLGSTLTASLDRIIRIDPVVTPASTTTDADGSIVNSLIETRAYAEGDPAQKRRYRHTMLTYRLIGGTSLYPSSTTYPSATTYPGSSNGYYTVTAVKGLDGAGSSSLIGTTIPSSDSSTVKRYDHQTISQAVTYKIETFSAPPTFSVYEVTNGYNQVRPGRTS